TANGGFHAPPKTSPKYGYSGLPIALGLCVIVPFAAGNVRARAAAMAVFGIALLLGLLAAGGPTFWRTWQAFGNPVYPYFGDVFGGAWNPPFAVADLRWKVHGFG